MTDQIESLTTAALLDLKSRVDDAWRQRSASDFLCSLSTRTANILLYEGISTVEELKDRPDWPGIQGLGSAAKKEIVAYLRAS